MLELPAASEGGEVTWDYRTLGLTLRSHPMKLLRPRLLRRFLTAAQLMAKRNGAGVSFCGIVTLRQRPETAKGVVFVSLEDETGNVQVIVWPSVRDAQPKELLRSRLLAAWPLAAPGRCLQLDREVSRGPDAVVGRVGDDLTRFPLMEANPDLAQQCCALAPRSQLAACEGLHDLISLRSNNSED